MPHTKDDSKKELADDWMKTLAASISVLSKGPVTAGLVDLSKEVSGSDLAMGPVTNGAPFAYTKVYVVSSDHRSAETFCRKFKGSEPLRDVSQLRGVNPERVMLLLHGDYFRNPQLRELKYVAKLRGIQFVIVLPEDEV